MSCFTASIFIWGVKRAAANWWHHLQHIQLLRYNNRELESGSSAATPPALQLLQLQPAAAWVCDIKPCHYSISTSRCNWLQLLLQPHSWSSNVAAASARLEISKRGVLSWTDQSERVSSCWWVKWASLRENWRSFYFSSDSSNHQVHRSNVFMISVNIIDSGRLMCAYIYISFLYNVFTT